MLDNRRGQDKFKLKVEIKKLILVLTADQRMTIF